MMRKAVMRVASVLEESDHTQRQSLVGFDCFLEGQQVWKERGMDDSVSLSVGASERLASRCCTEDE
jgi:hypothetical protein